MFELTMSGKARPYKVLCIGAHSDDIEIGCGGTILKLLSEGHVAEIDWIVLSADRQRKNEARESAGCFLSEAEKKTVVVKNFKGSFFPSYAEKIKEYFEQLRDRSSPDVIFTHYRHDLHQDHRVVSDLTWNTFRNHLILEYEIPKYDGDLGAPNCYVHLDQSTTALKVKHLLNCFETQRSKPWFADDTFLSILRLRGVECNAPQRYAEAFYCRKMLLGTEKVLRNEVQNADKNSR
jgi:LmbE family N-acetylglucosaminyl deacetylase